MKKAVVGKAVPDVEVQATGGKSLRLRDLKGKFTVLYFYPKDDTPGCTLEGQGFRDQHDRLKKLKAVVYGVSRDSLASHEKFKTKFKFPFDLIADEDEKLCQLFDVIREKSLYGRKYLGVDRSTFILDQDGVLRREFRGVKVKGHVDEVVGEIKKLQSPPSKRQ
ncbi:MAG TPA: peroxiredoxin [Candidatus Methylomirabilis sp.]|nr:peroxiredoxin [Candidatus Methylomirabilis sp.]